MRTDAVFAYDFVHLSLTIQEVILRGLAQFPSGSLQLSIPRGRISKASIKPMSGFIAR